MWKGRTLTGCGCRLWLQLDAFPSTLLPESISHYAKKFTLNDVSAECNSILSNYADIGKPTYKRQSQKNIRSVRDFPVDNGKFTQVSSEACS